MNSVDAIRQFEHQAERLLTIYKRMFEKVCEANNLTATQVLALITIQAQGEVRMTKLADGMCLTPGAVSSLVDRLVDNGLVERRTEPADRRAVFVHVTEKGQSMLKDAQRDKHARVSQVLSRMDPKIAQSLNNNLGELLTLWEAELASDSQSS